MSDSHITKPGSQELPTVPDAIELRNSMMVMMEQSQERMVRAVRNWVVAGVLVGLAVSAFNFWGINAIRSTQTARSNAVECQTEGIDGLLHDVPLAFAMDHNKADYAPIPLVCKVAR